MAVLFLSLNPKESILHFSEEWAKTAAANGIKYAMLPIPDDLNEVDLYNTAKKLAELFLEQISKG